MSDAEIIRRLVFGLALASAALAVVVACVLLSQELLWVGPVWAPWALVALSFGLGVLLARAAISTRPAAATGGAVFGAELQALQEVTARLDRLLGEGPAAELSGAREQLAPGLADLLKHSEQTAEALSDLDDARRRFAARLASMVCGLELLEVALRHRDPDIGRLRIPTFLEQATATDVQP